LQGLTRNKAQSLSSGLRITKTKTFKYKPKIPKYSEVRNRRIVKAKIKEIAGDFNVAGDVAEALNKKVEQMVKDACGRAEANGRKTIMAKDL
jgi:histone H3/H4